MSINQKEQELDPVQQFLAERREAIGKYAADKEWQDLSIKWMDKAFRHKYMYNFSALGRPIIQLPDEMVAFQEIVWKAKPDIIIETGIAHGGSLIQSAATLALLDYADAVQNGTVLDPAHPKRIVLGIDIDIRAHNRKEIENHPFYGRIKMIEGSSTDQATVDQVKSIAADYKRVMVCLDSNHTHDHVLSELNLYAPLVTKGCHCIVFDTIVENLPADLWPDRPWKPGNNPMTAMREFMKRDDLKDIEGNPLKFAIDHDIQDKLMICAAPEGYLKRI